MSIQDVTNRMRNLEARITEIERRSAAFEARSPLPEGMPADETPFAKALAARTEQKAPDARSAAPAVKEEPPIVVPAAPPRPAAAPPLPPPLPPAFLDARLVSEGPAPADLNLKPAEASPAKRVPEEILPALLDAAKRYKLDPALVAAVIDAESGWNAKAVSGKGALGLMQLMPGTADDMGVEDPLDPEENIFGGVRYLRKMLDRFPSMEQALAAYNAGPERVERAGGVPDIKETREYVDRVLSRYALRMNGDLGEDIEE